MARLGRRLGHVGAPALMGCCRMGFLYLTHEDVHLQTHGDTIRRPDLGPPWSSSTTRSRASAVSRWLGRLLRVEPLPARTAEQRQPLTQAADDLNVGAGYTRA